MQFAPYLFFSDGRCREAFDLYHRVLGGDVQMMTFADLPPGEGRPDGVTDDMVVNVALTLPGGALLMASDDPTGDGAGVKGCAVSIMLDDAAEGGRIFDELVEGGQTYAPFGPSFWSPGFGSGADRFGVQWMVNVEGDPAGTGDGS